MSSCFLVIGIAVLVLQTEARAEGNSRTQLRSCRSTGSSSLLTVPSGVWHRGEEPVLSHAVAIRGAVGRARFSPDEPEHRAGRTRPL